ncbi:MAG: helix-turn-helix domain-containing protein [Solirubrobacteraceae bacterium]
MDVGKLVRDARLERGLDQSELASRAATTQTYVSRVERGATTPALPTLERLLNAMGLRLQISVEAVSTGNSEPAQLRRDFLASTPEQRIEDAMTLSTFLTELASPPAEPDG